jgi:hypothetical protein
MVAARPAKPPPITNTLGPAILTRSFETKPRPSLSSPGLQKDVLNH